MSPTLFWTTFIQQCTVKISQLITKSLELFNSEDLSIRYDTYKNQGSKAENFSPIGTTFGVLLKG
jgi:hypothetical protein